MQKYLSSDSHQESQTAKSDIRKVKMSLTSTKWAWRYRKFPQLPENFTSQCMLQTEVFFFFFHVFYLSTQTHMPQWHFPVQPTVGGLLNQGVGFNDPQRSLPTPVILWFYECKGYMWIHHHLLGDLKVMFDVINQQRIHKCLCSYRYCRQIFIKQTSKISTEFLNIPMQRFDQNL